MWNEILNDKDIGKFMKKLCGFHDSCIKEMRYISGAYVNKELSMYPINDRRTLSVIVQRQFDELSVIEMEFSGLRFLKLFPVFENYTCEILDASMFIKDGCIWWCDRGEITGADVEKYDGTVICAAKLRWRALEKSIGNEEYFISNETKDTDD